MPPCTAASEYIRHVGYTLLLPHSPDDAFDILSAQGATVAVSGAVVVVVGTSAISPARSAVRYQSPQDSSQACAAPADRTGSTTTTPTSRRGASGPPFCCAAIVLGIHWPDD